MQISSLVQISPLDPTLHSTYLVLTLDKKSGTQRPSPSSTPAPAGLAVSMAVAPAVDLGLICCACMCHTCYQLCVCFSRGSTHSPSIAHLLLRTVAPCTVHRESCTHPSKASIKGIHQRHPSKASIKGIHQRHPSKGHMRLPWSRDPNCCRPPCSPPCSRQGVLHPASHIALASGRREVQTRSKNGARLWPATMHKRRRSSLPASPLRSSQHTKAYYQIPSTLVRS